jgi:glycosyltransferase involved in cell wall biosynthesis
LVRLAYMRPDGAIQTSGLNPPDARYLAARHEAVIPNGIPDDAAPYLNRIRADGQRVRVLYVGKLDESKGVMVLLESVRQLAGRTGPFTVSFMGQFGSADFERKAMAFCSANGLTEIVRFIGLKVGAAKWQVFSDSDILCFPSFFEAESFGNVALEAMMFQLPVVATRWRGIPDLIADGENGLLVPANDPAALSSALERLINDPRLRLRMGAAGRCRYLARFTIERHLNDVEAFLYKVANS